MKKILFLLLISLSLPSFSGRILLTGKPVVMIPEENYYRFPPNYNPENYAYHFVDISGDNRVCFIADQPGLDTLDLLRINIVQDNKMFLWYCYIYKKAFFKINF